MKFKVKFKMKSFKSEEHKFDVHVRCSCCRLTRICDIYSGFLAKLDEQNRRETRQSCFEIRRLGVVSDSYDPLLLIPSAPTVLASAVDINSLTGNIRHFQRGNCVFCSVRKPATAFILANFYRNNATC